MCLSAIETGTLFRVLARIIEGEWELELKDTGSTWRMLLEREGHMPLPSYILKRRSGESDMPEDRLWYQTAFADRDGAIAAPYGTHIIDLTKEEATLFGDLNSSHRRKVRHL